MKLYDFQRAALDATASRQRVAYYLDMGLGKTFVGAEKAMQLHNDILVVCQKSKVTDWCNHFASNYDCSVYNMTKKSAKKNIVKTASDASAVTVWVINYDLVWRRVDADFLRAEALTLLLDESSCIQNETSKRTKFISRSIRCSSVILLSGTPCNGKYENLWTQCRLLGWYVSKANFWGRYIRYFETDKNGYPIKIVTGYKNVEELKDNLRKCGAVFMQTKDVFSLPEQVIIDTHVAATADYRAFMRDKIVTIDKNIQLVGDTPLTALLYARQLSAAYNDNKYTALDDLIESTTDRLVIFYNFNEELKRIKEICQKAGRKISEVNGHKKDTAAFDVSDDSVMLVQYQSGAMGLNLQAANKVIFFSPPLSAELYAQAFKRIHRIGQTKTCFYYRLIADGIEEKIYKTLEKREDYTLQLFVQK